MGNDDSKPKLDNLGKDAKFDTNIRNSYSFLSVIGKGGFGKVWKVSDKKSRRVTACKVIDKAKVMVKKSVKSIMSEK